jgi:hypothetical protein
MMNICLSVCLSVSFRFHEYLMMIFCNKICSLLPVVSRCASDKVLNVTKHFCILDVLQKLLLSICSRWHDIQISAMLASVSSIAGIPELERPPS